MTNTEASREAMRIAIARACGWTFDEEECEHYGWPPIQGYDRSINGNGRVPCPDYCNDLNAAITLCDHLAGEWDCEIDRGKLWRCCFQRPQKGNRFLVDEHCHKAETLAEAICGAFIKTLNLPTHEKHD